MTCNFAHTHSTHTDTRFGGVFKMKEAHSVAGQADL